MAKKLLLIVNPRSGTMKKQKQLLAVLQSFTEANLEVSVHVTRRSQDAIEVVRARGGEFDLLVAMGGDGTLNEVVTGALASDFAGEIGFIPCGTTNDLASTLSLPKDPVKAAQLIAQGQARDLDFGAFNQSRCFSYIAAFGTLAEISYTTGQKAKNMFGHLAYVMNGVDAALRLKPYSMRVTCDDQVFEGDFVFGAVANAYTVGGVIKLKRDTVDLADGLHEMALIKNPQSVADYTALVHELAHARFNGKNVIFARGSRFTFEAQQPISWCVDGEHAGDEERVTLRNLHGKIKIFRP